MSNYLDDIVLEKEQKDLLKILVEASRSTPPNERQRFYVSPTFGNLQADLIHPAIKPPFTVYYGDIEILMKANLLAGSYGSFRMIDFDVTPLGFRYYEYLQQKIGNSEKRVEISMHEYLDAENFQARYPNAFQKWAQAEVLLWGEDSQAHLTTIGHLCREATLDFFTSLMENSHLPISCKGSNSTISNLRTVINSQAGNLGSAESQFLEALVAYWGGLSDLIQRQEHGAQKEGKPLVWEDARRIIFQTINVMYEVDRSLVK